MPFKKDDPNINRSGRPPKGKSFADVLNKLLAEEIPNQEGMDKKEALCRKLMKFAFDGEQWAMNAVFDRVDGKPRQSIDQTTKNVSVNITQEDADNVT